MKHEISAAAGGGGGGEECCGICGHLLPHHHNGEESSWLLHHFRHRGSYRRLCTNCVLNSSTGLFCPLCLHVFDDCRSSDERVTCLSCSSVAHAACVTTIRFTCSTCSNPNFVFFKFNESRHPNNTNNKKFIDHKSAKALVAASKLSANSMKRAALLARLEAERKVKDAVLAKSKAKDALDRLLLLTAREKEMIVEEEEDVDNPISGQSD
ncbi:hypothetical protein ACFE04_009925 [Oxalis oulophora]